MRYDADGNRTVTGAWYASPVNQEALRVRAAALGGMAKECLAAGMPIAAAALARDAAGCALAYLAYLAAPKTGGAQ